MYKEIKDALALFAEKKSFNLTFLKKNLNLSDDQHEKLTAYLLHQKIIQKADEKEWGREYKYEQSELGAKIYNSIRTFEVADVVLRYYAESSSWHLLKDVSEQMGVPTSSVIAEILVNAQAIVPFGTPVKEGMHYKITDAGKSLSDSGGFTRKYAIEIEAESNEITAPTPTGRMPKSKNKHDDMLLYLYEQNEPYPGEWVDLLAYYSSDKESYIREIADELERQDWIKLMPVGILGMYFYRNGEKSDGVSFPNPLKAKIAYAGMKHVEQLQKPHGDDARTIYNGPVAITQGPNSPINSKMLTDYAVDNSDVKISAKQPKDMDRKKGIDWEKILKYLGAALVLAAALYKALEAMHVI